MLVSMSLEKLFYVYISCKDMIFSSIIIPRFSRGRAMNTNTSVEASIGQ